MKVLAILIILVACVIGIVPQYTNCDARLSEAAPATASPAAMASPSAVATTATTAIQKMKCYWTAHAEIAVAIPLVAIGVLLFFARRKETKRALGVLTAILGAVTILVPVSLIGTCLNDTMVCNTQMKPVLFITGGIVIALGVAVAIVGAMSKGDGDDGAVA